MKRDPRLSIAAVTCACLPLGACAEEEPPPRPSVVLISIDTLRPDHLGCYGYRRNTSPNIDALAERGAVFEQHISSAPWTLPAHAAMFTSVPDSVHGVVDPIGLRLAEEFETLPESFQRAGYRTAGFFAGPYLHPSFGLGQGFDTYEDCVDVVGEAELDERGEWSMRDPVLRASHHGITNDKVYARWKAFHEDAKSRARERPFFAFVHLWDVHFDFAPPAPYDTLFDPDYDGPFTGRDFFHDPRINAAMPKRDQDHIVALYDGEIRWTDAIVGKIKADLEAAGQLVDTLVVITSDHGTELFDHGGKGHRTTLYDEQLRIPLVLHYPRKVIPGRYPGQTRMIDLGPTLRELVGLPPVATTMGTSLAEVALGHYDLLEDRPAVSELMSVGRSLRSVRTPNQKVVVDLSSMRASWFDLLLDPGEREPRPFGADRASKRVVDRYDDAVESIDRGIRARPAGPSEAEPPESIRRSLSANGYVGTGDG